MPKVQKATIGIRPINKMFRVQTRAGDIADAVIGLRGAQLSESYFEKVGWLANRQGVAITSEVLGNSLVVDQDNIRFTFDRYDVGARFDFQEMLKDFGAIWTAINSILKVRDIRRIGIVAEHRFAEADASKRILSQLSNLPLSGHSAKCLLRYELRSTPDRSIPDDLKSAFTNLIHEIYDSIGDADHPEPGHINANLDAQYYYAPLFNGNVEGELLGLYNKVYKPASAALFEHLRKQGLANAAAEEN